MDEYIIEEVKPYDLSPKQVARAEAAIPQAEQDLKETRINMRVRTTIMDVMRQAATLYRMPYQAYSGRRHSARR